jgi:hypothetical protein
MTDPGTGVGNGSSRRSTGDLVKDLARDSSALVRKEIELAQTGARGGRQGPIEGRSSVRRGRGLGAFRLARR